MSNTITIISTSKESGATGIPARIEVTIVHSDKDGKTSTTKHLRYDKNTRKFVGVVYGVKGQATFITFPLGILSSKNLDELMAA